MDSKHPRVQPTNWHVITGAPCSGKTTIIECLSKQGYQVVTEVARAYIDSCLAKGQTLEKIKSDPMAFEHRILMEKARIERSLATNELVFLDRAVPDSIAYYQLEGLVVDEPLAYSRRVNYKKVFLFHRLSFEKDSVRIEDQLMAARIEKLLTKCYAQLGYDLIHVPVMSITRRIEFVLQHVCPIPD